MTDQVLQQQIAFGEDYARHHTELQNVFARHFARDDVPMAKLWLARWYASGQGIPELHTHPTFTLRAMAGHVSDYLEFLTGYEPTAYGSGNKIYYDTKFGSELYYATC